MMNFKDAVVEKAYKDYMYTRDMMNPDEAAGISDLATVSLRFLKQHGKLDKVGEMGPGGAYAVKINVNVSGENEPWLLTFRNSAAAGDGTDARKNAAECLQNCVRDSLTEKSDAYAAIRLSGSGNPLLKTIGYEPEGGMDAPRKAAMESLGGFASAIDRLSIATGLADEIYNPRFENSRFEAAAVVSALPEVEAIVNKREFSKTNEDNAAGVDVTENISAEAVGDWRKAYIDGEALGFAAAMRQLSEDINLCSRRGLAQRFDSTIGTSAVMMPYGGVNQLTAVQAASYKIPIEKGDTDDCSVMSWASNPYIYEASAYHGGYLAVVESVAKLVASGASFHEVYLSVMAGRGGGDGRAMAALLGAFEAEMGLSVPVVSADTDSGADAFVSYAVTMGRGSELISPEFKGTGHKVVAAAYTPGMGGVAEAVMKMSFGNGIGFEFADDAWSDEPALTNEKIFGYSYGAIILEMMTDDPIRSRSVNTIEIGRTTERQDIRKGSEAISIGELLMLSEGKLESVYPANSDGVLPEVADVNYAARSWHTPIFKRAVPKVLIPALPGATSARDVARAVRSAGGTAEILALPAGSAEEILRSAESFAEAVGTAQIIFLPDGYAGSVDGAGGDVDIDLAELTSYIFRNDRVKERIGEFLDKKDGLIAGIGSGFKALLDLGLLPGGEISDVDGPSLTENALGAHQSRIVRVRISSNKSPWLRSCKPGTVQSLPISCFEGRFTASDEMLKKLAVNGQIATQYADDKGVASSDIRFNPAGSMLAIEGISSADGRVLGRMGHADRAADGLYRNVPGTYFTDMFENAIRYFR